MFPNLPQGEAQIVDEIGKEPSHGVRLGSRISRLVLFGQFYHHVIGRSTLESALPTTCFRDIAVHSPWQGLDLHPSGSYSQPLCARVAENNPRDGRFSTPDGRRHRLDAACHRSESVLFKLRPGRYVKQYPSSACSLPRMPVRGTCPSTRVIGTWRNSFRIIARMLRRHAVSLAIVSAYAFALL